MAPLDEEAQFEGVEPRNFIAILVEELAQAVETLRLRLSSPAADKSRFYGDFLNALDHLLQNAPSHQELCKVMPRGGLLFAGDLENLRAARTDLTVAMARVGHGQSGQRLRNLERFTVGIVQAFQVIETRYRPIALEIQAEEEALQVAAELTEGLMELEDAALPTFQEEEPTFDPVALDAARGVFREELGVAFPEATGDDPTVSYASLETAVAEQGKD